MFLDERAKPGPTGTSSARPRHAVSAATSAPCGPPARPPSAHSASAAAWEAPRRKAAVAVANANASVTDSMQPRVTSSGPASSKRASAVRSDGVRTGGDNVVAAGLICPPARAGESLVGGSGALRLGGCIGPADGAVAVRDMCVLNRSSVAVRCD